MTDGSDRYIAAGLVILGLALGVNSLLGPLVLGAVTYPLSETLVNQTIGLEAVSLGLVAPWCLAAGALVRRNHPAWSVFAMPPAAYAAYMFAQYVVGPAYVAYRPIQLLHLASFVLGGGLLVAAWTRLDAEALPAITPGSRRRHALALLLLAAFTAARYLSAIGGMVTGAGLDAEFAADPAMYWAIVLLDLGVVVPVTTAASLGLRLGRPWARRAQYAIAGWFTLVPVSVAAMGLVMWVNDDPNASLAQVAVLAAAALLFTAYATSLYRPLLRG